MKVGLFLLVVLISYQMKSAAQASDTIQVSSFGVLPNSFADAVTGVQNAIARCKQKKSSVLYFEKGRYDFWPDRAVKKSYFASNTSRENDVVDKIKTIGLFFESMQNLTIEGNGAVFIFHGKMTPWAFVNCENLHLQNLTLDFERPSMSEMTLVNVSASQVVATVHADSKFAILDNRLEWYGEGWKMHHYHAILANPSTGVNTYSSWLPFLKSKAELIAPQTIQFTGNFSSFNAKSGEVLTIRDPIRDQVGGFINLSRNMYFKNLHIQYMHGLGILAQFSENLYFDSLTVAPDPKRGRVISCFADAMHFSSCKGEIKIENSFFKGLHDDPINVHGTHLKITEIVSPKHLKVRFMHPETYGFEAFFAGDSIALVHPQSLEVFGGGVIQSAKLVASTEMELVLATSSTDGIIVGDCLENISWNPSVTVRNCRFESVNTRGLLLTTRKKVLIESNHFYRTGMHAILIANDASNWYESGPVEDVVIRNNVFEECAYNSAPKNYVIAIAPENHQLVSNYYVHRNIRIENNFFKVYEAPLLSARSTAGLIFSHNTITPSYLMKPVGDKPAVQLTTCKEVTILNNHFTTKWLSFLQLEKMNAQQVITDLPIKNN